MANIDSNGYTFGYAIVMTLVVAIALAGVSTGLRPIQKKEEDIDKKKSILNAVAPITDKSLVEAEYAKRIKEIVVDASGKEVSGVSAFDIEIKKEYKKPVSERKLPLYVYTTDSNEKNYILPLHGAGLWDEIWGFVAVKGDFNTVIGSAYDHKGETPGLGAEIKTDWFQNQFKGKKLAKDNEFALKILKGKGNPIEGKPFQVDGISGATITGDGVQDMLVKGYNSYTKYFAAK